MKINRSELLNEMIAFFQESGVVVGDPGVGKTYLLSEMVDLLLNQKIPATMIRLDFLTQGSDLEIAEALGISGDNWIESLKRISLPGNSKGMLIFDAYDTIKDEKLKTAILNQIAKVKRELSGWSILVSVRTYEAARSQRLIDLFPAEFNSDNIHCRRFTVPKLSNQELDTFLAGHEKLKAIYEGGTEKLEDILKIPFFLSLLNTILNKTDATTETLKVLKSEIELLEMYWVKVVYKDQSSLQTELFLRNLTLKMVADRTLSVDKMEYLNELSTDKVLIAGNLLGDNVLAEQGTNTPRIAYAHNILFDYAVSKLVIKDTVSELLSFIAEDKARPFFLRPSYIYFFARLWYNDHVKFWAIYDELSKSADDVIILFTKLIPSTVIAKEFEETTQLPFLESAESHRIMQVTSVLQALRFHKQSRNKRAQASLLLKLSTALQIEFCWDFAFILDELIKSPDIKGDPSTFAICGQSARNLMEYLLAHRSNSNIDQLAGYRGTSMVAKTYSSNMDASRAILTKVLDMLDLPDFNIAYFSTLTEDLKEFYNDDPAFCATIYAKVFDHQENSSEPAPMHTGVLMSFTSSRHDQFGTSHFRLQQLFPKFLASNPELAISVGLSVSNGFIDKKNAGGFILPDTNTIPFNFRVNAVDAHYKVDFSHFWGEFSVRTDSTQHTQLIINYFESLISENKTDLLAEGLQLYFAHANNAYNWKMLLELGARHPKMLSGLLFEILLQPAILYWNDTLVAAASFLHAAIPFYNDDQVLLVEKSILSLLDYVSNDELEKANLVMLRLLSQIPKDRLNEPSSLAILATSEGMSNEPIVSYHSSSEVLTTETFLSEEGVDIKTDENRELLAENQIMVVFSRQFANKIADSDAYDHPLQAAIKTFGLIKDRKDLTPRLVETLLTSIASVCTDVLKSNLVIEPKKPITTEQYTIIKEMILFCLDQHTDSDTFAEQNSSPGSGYSSTPRSQASFALLKLFSLTQDQELLPPIKKYASDKNPVTRYGIVQSLSLLYKSQNHLFWEIVNDRLANETDWFTKSAVIYSLDLLKIFTDEPDQFIQAYQVAKDEIFTMPEGSNSFLEAFLVMALGFLRRIGDQRIKDILEECLNNNLSIGPQLIFQSFEIIEPENLHRNYSDPEDVARSQRVLDTLMELLEKCERILVSAKPEIGVTKEIEHAFKIIDTVIQRIYFSMQVNKRILQRNRIEITPEAQEQFYFLTKPLLDKILHISRQLGDGHMQGHSAHYFIEIMGEALRFDAHYSLASTFEATTLASGTNYTFDHSAIQEVVKYTEKLLADHKNMLSEPVAFEQVMGLLNIYVRSGWPQALDLLWKLDEIFR